MAMLFGKAFIDVVEGAFKLPFIVSFTSLIVVTLVATYIAVKINWRIVFESYHEEGIFKGTSRLLYEVARVFRLR